MSSVYLDNAASAPIDPNVTEFLASLYKAGHGNPSSIHREGVAAAMLVERARAILAGRIGSQPDEITFTSGGTESNNLALLGSLGPSRGGHLILSAFEHPSVAKTAERLRELGSEVSVLPINGAGRVDPEEVGRLIRPNTRLVSIMHVNNEIGSVQEVAAIGRICRENGVLFHCDASQSFGKVEINVERDHIDLLSISAHKFHGPKGIGALYARKGSSVAPLTFGGGQERGLRPGTVPAELVAAMGEAASRFSPADVEHITRLRSLLLAELEGTGARINGGGVCGIVNFSLPGLDGKQIVLALARKGVAVSSGSACSSGKKVPSPALLAMGRTEREAFESVRVSLGKQNTESDVLRFSAMLKEVLLELT